MLDPPKPVNPNLSLVVAFALALFVALVTIAACGSPTADAPPGVSPSPPDDSPADRVPTPTDVVKATVPVEIEPADLVGTWTDGQGLELELSGNGLYTQTYRYREPETGAWSLQEDGSLELEGQSYDPIPHGNLLLQGRVGEGDSVRTIGILQRVGEDGNILAYEPWNPTKVPPIEPASILTITVLDNWTGFSPVAPIEATYRLQPTTDGFSGMADFSVAGYTEEITRSVPISIPLAVIEELLALLESTPVEVGQYMPLFDHTDDFPAVTIAVESSAGDLIFATKSQGSRHIPWSVVVGQDPYVTYADTPAQALELLDPYLAREVQQALFDEALARDQ